MAKQLTDGQFVELLTSCQVRLRSFARSLVHSRADADDVLQDACVALWEKREGYDADRKFFSWACGVVLIEVLRYRQNMTTDKLVFDEALINTLSTEYVLQEDELDRRRRLLRQCIAKLNNRDRGLLKDRYQSNVKPKHISEQRSWPLSSVYSALTRIRALLHQCIETSLTQQTRS